MQDTLDMQTVGRIILDQFPKMKARQSMGESFLVSLYKEKTWSIRSTQVCMPSTVSDRACIELNLDLH